MALIKATHNIVITGFMGTGKTTVSQLVATQLDRQWVDMDDLIVTRQQKTIPQIFAEFGEPAFRQMEHDLCLELAGAENLVISTGGGALVPAENRAIFLPASFMVCLIATPETIEARLQKDGDGRPLASHWRDLLDKRAGAYAEIPYQVDTTDLSPEQVAEEIIRLWKHALQ